MNKGQAALEYLVTYAWVLVVVIIVVIALVLLVRPLTEADYTSTNVCKAYKINGGGDFINPFAVSVPMLLKYDNLIHKGKATIIGGVWFPLDGYECFVKLYNVCDQNDYCLDYSIRLEVSHSDFMEWCNDECELWGRS